MIIVNVPKIIQNIRFKPHLTFYFLLVVFIAANGVIIPLGRDWTAPQVMAIGMIFFLLLRVVAKEDNRGIRVNSTSFFILLLWVILQFLSIYFAPEQPLNTNVESALQSYRVVGVMYLVWILLDILLMWGVYTFAKDGRILIKTFKILLWSSVFYSLYGIYQYTVVSLLGLGANPIVYAYNYHYLFYDYIVRLLSLSREPLYFVNYISPVIIVSSALLITKSSNVLGISKKKLITITSINIIAFFLAKSTGGYIGLLASLLVILSIYYRTYIQRLSLGRVIGGIVSLVIFALIFYQLFGSGVERKLSRLFDPTSGYTRIVSLIEGTESVFTYPLLGFGLGHSQFFISTEQIHNAYLNIAAESGLLSLVCFLGFLLYLPTKLFKAYKIGGKYKGLILGIAGMFVYILIQWLSFYAYIVLFAWFLFGIILSLPCAIKSLHKKKVTLKPGKAE